jgi:L-fuconolactonase
VTAPRIDAHQHFWSLARGDYGWLTPALKPIYRDFGPDDLRPYLDRWSIAGTVLVQAAPTEAETHYMLDVAARSAGMVRGVVGWTDFAVPDAPERVGKLAANSLLRGLRPMIHDIPDPRWMLGSALAPGLRAMQASGLRFDALVRPVHLPHLRRFVDLYPDLPVVIDHGAKPDIAHGGFNAWAAGMRALARETRVWCKLSGLATEAASGWQARDLKRYVDFLLAEFGDRRLIWGSDWPVVDLARGYDAWRQTTEELLAGCRPEGRECILGRNAIEFYGLK